MKPNYLLGLALLIATLPAHGFDEKAAAKMVEKYSALTACEVGSGFKAFKLIGKKGVDENYSDKYVVVWYGDDGCAGGAGTISTQLTVVSLAAFNNPIVEVDNGEPIDLDLKFHEKAYQKGDTLIIEGRRLGNDDAPQFPTEAVRYVLKFADDGSLAIKSTQVLGKYDENDKLIPAH